MKKKLYFVGLGIDTGRDVTLGAIAAMKEADCVFYNSFPNAAQEFEGWGAKRIISLDHLYLDGGIDIENYRRMEEFIFEQFAEHDVLCFATHGHPRLGVTLTKLVERRAAAENVQLFVVPGVSSFDCMINDLQRDPLEFGTQVLDANSILLFNKSIDPHSDCFIYHICSVGTSRTHFNDAKKDNLLERLQAWLLHSYAPDQEVVIISSKVDEVYHRGFQIHFPLCDLSKQIDRIDFGSTMFIKGRFPSVYNREIYSILKGTTP